MVNILSILCGSLYPRLSESNNRNKQNLKADDQYSPLNGRGVRAPWRPSLSHVEKCNALNASLLIPFHFIFFLRMEWFVFVLFCCLRFTVLHGRQNETRDPRLVWQPRGFAMVAKGNDTNRANRKKIAASHRWSRLTVARIAAVSAFLMTQKTKADYSGYHC